MCTSLFCLKNATTGTCFTRSSGAMEGTTCGSGKVNSQRYYKPINNITKLTFAGKNKKRCA